MTSRKSIPELLASRCLGRDQVVVRQDLSTALHDNLRLSNLTEVDTCALSHGLACMDLDLEESRYLLSGALDGSLYVHDTSVPGSDLALHIGRSNKHCHTAYVASVSWGLDTGLFLSSSRDGLLKVWDTNEGRPADQFPVGREQGGITCHAPARGVLSHLVAVATQGNAVRLVDLRVGSTSHQLRGHGSQVTCLAWSPGTPGMLASGEGLGQDGRGGGKILLWDVRQAKSKLQSLDYNNVKGRPRDPSRLANAAHQGRVLGLAFSGCGRYLVSVGKDHRVRRWDVMTGRNLKTKFPEVDTGLSCSQPWTLPIVCTTGGSRDVLLVPQRATVLRLRLDTGESLPPLEGHFGTVTALAYSPGRLQLFSGDRDRHILVWEPGGQGAGQTENPEAVRDAWSSEDEDS